MLSRQASTYRSILSYLHKQDISWDEAFTEIVEKFKGIQNKYGKNSLAVYLGNPNAHSLGNTLVLKPFMKSLGTMNRFSSASTDQMPHHVASNFMLGAGMLIPVPDIDRTDFMLIIGGNPVVSNGSMMTAPNVIGRMKAIQNVAEKSSWLIHVVPVPLKLPINIYLFVLKKMRCCFLR